MEIHKASGDLMKYVRQMYTEKKGSMEIPLSIPHYPVPFLLSSQKKETKISSY